MFGKGSVGVAALNTALAKATLNPIQAVFLGIMCNALVCMAVWLCFSARSTIDKILAIIFPISAFVAAGFEHSVANMYFIPMGLLIKQFAPASFWAADALSKATPPLTLETYARLTWGNFFVNNLIPVTIGNIIGGAGLVGLVYWFAYLRTRKA
jgi:formate/nitrite transporter